MGFTIAIDGPAASGKGTVSRALAKAFGFAHLDTGLLYRAVGRRFLNGEEPLHAARTLQAEDLEDDTLRNADVAQAASRVAAIPQVRQALLDFQRAFARRAGGAILDGRDIGTVICPEADVKMFVIASAEKRAERRHRELVGKGADITYDAVLADVLERDARDMNRADAPLKPAEDAVQIDTTDMTIADAVAQATRIVKNAMT